ncbi:MAG: formylglycine-generating enzyme family protein [Verrucomicrobiae bacterium]|nr:formylglycine-generating enzyme family protein [Verrucomicrobiae bacterium]
MKLVWIPPGQFVMGDPDGPEDEQRLKPVTIEPGFWMSTREVSNEQFRRFDPAHDSRYYAKRHARTDDEGLTLNEPQQPVVRISWLRAMEFCQWLSAKTDLEAVLPAEEQWEYACRDGTTTPFHFGTAETDFSAWADMGDASFADKTALPGIFHVTGGIEHLIVERVRHWQTCVSTTEPLSPRPSVVTSPTRGASATCMATPPNGHAPTPAQTRSCAAARSSTTRNAAAAPAALPIPRGNAFSTCVSASSGKRQNKPL